MGEYGSEIYRLPVERPEGPQRRPFKYEVVSDVGNVVAHTITKFTADCTVAGLVASGHAGAWKVRRLL